MMPALALEAPGARIAPTADKVRPKFSSPSTKMSSFVGMGAQRSEGSVSVVKKVTETGEEM